MTHIINKTSLLQEFVSTGGIKHPYEIFYMQNIWTESCLLKISDNWTDDATNTNKFLQEGGLIYDMGHDLV